MNKEQKAVEKAKLQSERKVLEELKKQYKRAAEDIQGKINIHTNKIDIILNEYDELDDDMKSILQAQIYQKQYQEQLKRQVDAIIEAMNDNQYDTIQEYLDDCYNIGFIGSAYDLHGQGIPLIAPIDQKAMVSAVTLNPKLSAKLYGTYMTDMKRHVVGEISRGIATADSFEHIARNISNATNMSFNKTMRIVRTEGHGIQIRAAVDMQEQAKKAGADVVKQWDAQLDARTRNSHARLDGEIRELDEEFSNGMRWPSDPSGGASEVINCRCALLQRAKWGLDEEELDILKQRAEYFGLDKSKNFDDFKSKYLDAAADTKQALPKKTQVFTKDENDALEWYVSGEGMWINQYLRNPAEFGELSDNERRFLRLLTSSTERELPESITKVYRSVDAKAIFGDLGWKEWEALEGNLLYGLKENQTEVKNIINRVKNKTITEKGFMSTTKDYDVAVEWGDFTGAERPVVIEFDVPKGIKGADLKKFDIEGDEQFEVLLATNTKYTVKNISAKDGRIYIKVELEVPKQNSDIGIDNVKAPKTMKTQYKDVDPMNEYDFYSEEQELFRLDSIKELAGYNDKQAKEALAALCGTREEYLKNSEVGILGTDSGWFSGGDRAIRKLATPEAEKKAKVIHDYIMDAPNYEGAIYRGATITKEQLNSLEVGGIFEENGAIASWSTQDSVAKLFAEARGEQFEKLPVILELEQSTHCTPAAHLSIFGNAENEVLVSNMLNDKFIITDISENNGITRIKLKERGN